MGSFIDSLLIIIVTYNTALDECETFRSICCMKEDGHNLNVFVYDNSIDPQVIKKYDGISIEYFHDPLNSGVSKAYNTGGLYAQKQSKKWVLLLDQDTTLPNSILTAYSKATILFPNLKLFAPVLLLADNRIFSPCNYKFKRGFHLKEINEGVHSLNQVAPVNSGMLIDVDSFFEVGGYNEKVKLDFSDFQFIERFRKKNSDFYVLGIKCQQDFSDDEVSYTKQINRFKYYCSGARNIEKHSLYDTVQYASIVFSRALMLAIKHKNMNFITTYIDSFLKSN